MAPCLEEGCDTLQRKRRRRGLTPVISSILLSAVVIAIGGAVWSYSQGAATVIANDYVDGTMSLLNEVTERFTIEQVSNNSDGSFIYVWVYNYGEVDIVVDLYVTATGASSSTLGTPIDSGDIVKIEVDFQSDPFESGDEVVIKGHTRRQNNVHYTYYVQ